MVRFARAAYESMVAQAEAGAPQEVCGVLAGSDGDRGDDESRVDVGSPRVGEVTDERRADGEHPDDDWSADAGGPDDERRVAAVHRVPNVADWPRTEYRMDPETQLSAIDVVEDSGLDVVGFYHSHPAGPARPSPTDEERATWPGYVYAIVSLSRDEPEFRAWEWTGEAFARLDVTVEE